MRTETGFERVDDVREDVADRGTEQRKDDDDDDGDEDEDERVLDQTLTFFTRLINHDDVSLE